MPSDLTIPLGQAGSHLAPGTQVTVGVRPEYVVLRADGEADGLAGTIVLVETVGSEDYLTVNVGPALRCVVRVDNRLGSRREGENVRLMLPEASLHLFDAEGLRIESPVA